MKTKQRQVKNRGWVRFFIVAFCVVFVWKGQTGLAFLVELSQRVPKDTTHLEREMNTEATEVSEVRAYSSALHVLQTGTGKQTVEGVYLLGKIAAKTVGPILEGLTKAELAILKNKMQGFDVFIGETVGAIPEITFFKQLAKQKGNEVDVMFFDLLDQTLREGSFWPVYVEQLTDYGGCAKYGSGLLVEFYGRWWKFQQMFPLAYKNDVRDRLNDIKYDLISSHLIHESELPISSMIHHCGSVADVMKELELFLRTYPDAEFAPDVKKHLEAIRKKSGELKK